jgi:hypothetical protein
MSARALSRGIRTTLVGLLLIALLFALYTAQRASATHHPADRAAAAADEGETTFTSNDPEEVLLTATIRTSKPADLMLHVSLECEITTQHEWNGPRSETSARGRIRTWVEVDNAIVPIQSSSQPPQNPPPAGNETDKVTFCERDEDLSRNDQDESLDQTLHSWVRRHRDANAFNWVRLNAGAGIHTVEVVADYLEEEVASAGDTAQVQAAVGNRLLIIEPTEMSVDVSVSNPGSS